MKKPVPQIALVLFLAVLPVVLYAASTTNRYGATRFTEGVSIGGEWRTTWPSGSGSGTSDHADLSNLAWTASGHTGTPARLAGFFEGGAAGYAGFGAGIYLDGDDNLAVSNEVISGAASGAVAYTWGDHAGLYLTADQYSGTVNQVSGGLLTINVDLDTIGLSSGAVAGIIGSMMSTGRVYGATYWYPPVGDVLGWTRADTAGTFSNWLWFSAAGVIGEAPYVPQGPNDIGPGVRWGTNQNSALVTTSATVYISVGTNLILFGNAVGNTSGPTGMAYSVHHQVPNPCATGIWDSVSESPPAYYFGTNGSIADLWIQAYAVSNGDISVTLYTGNVAMASCSIMGEYTNSTVGWWFEADSPTDTLNTWNDFQAEVARWAPSAGTPTTLTNYGVPPWDSRLFNCGPVPSELVVTNTPSGGQMYYFGGSDGKGYAGDAPVGTGNASTNVAQTFTALQTFAPGTITNVNRRTLLSRRSSQMSVAAGLTNVIFDAAEIGLGATNWSGPFLQWQSTRSQYVRAVWFIGARTGASPGAADFGSFVLTNGAYAFVGSYATDKSGYKGTVGASPEFLAPSGMVVVVQFAGGTTNSIDGPVLIPSWLEIVETP